MKKEDMHGLFAYHFNPDLFGEAQTAPHLRAAPFQEKIYRKLVQTILEAKNGGSSEDGQLPWIQPSELCMLLDGGKAGLAKAIASPWKALSHAAHRKVEQTSSS